MAHLARKMSLALLEGTVNSLDQILVSGCGQEHKNTMDMWRYPDIPLCFPADARGGKKCFIF